MLYRIIQIEVAVPEHSADGELRDFISNTLPAFRGDNSDIITDWRYTGVERSIHAETDDKLYEGEIFDIANLQAKKQ